MYFAGSVWAVIAATYLLALVGQRSGPLRPVLKAAAFHDLGVLLLAR